MLSNERVLKTILRDRGYSITKPRLAIFDALQGSSPLFMHELVARLDTAVNRASVYRTIDLFEKLHITNRLSIGWKYKIELSDTFNEHHHHIVCTICNKIEDLLENAALEHEILHLGTQHGYHIASHQIELRGICLNCRKN